jgi:hypothetical protein
VRLHRFLVPAAAAIVLIGVLAVLVVALKRPDAPHPTPDVAERARPQLTSEEVGELLKLKSEAEALVIQHKLAEAHAKYREFFIRAQGREVGPKDMHFWDLLERAKNDQDYVFRLLLAEQVPAAALNAGQPATRPAGASTLPATTQSFVDTYPPYRNLTTRPATAASAAATPASSPASTTDAATGALPSAQAAAILASLPEPKRIKVTRTPRDPSGFSDAAIGQSLAMANEFLLAQFKDGEIQQGRELSESYRQGLNALVVYALLNSGQATRDPRLQSNAEFTRVAIDHMKLHPMSTDASKAQQPVVYSRSLRAQVLALANRVEDRELLKDDVKWLIDAAVDGAYSYDDRSSVRVIKADPRQGGIPSGMRGPNVPQPPAPGQKQTPPKTMGPPRDQQPRPAAPAAGPQSATPAALPLASSRLLTEQPWLAWRGTIYADGYHDPITGREVGPIGPGQYRLPPPMLPPYPPQELPDKYAGPFVWDNSNSQYGLAGVAAGADVGVEVPDAYWAAVEQHWMTCQLKTGEWPYRKDTPGGRLSMTCGGIASLLATQDFLEAPTVARVGRQPTPAINAANAGFAWLEGADNAVNVAGPRTVYLGYTLHALGRVGLASGYKYFGSHDWYRHLARQVVLSQWPNGSWGRSDQPTADTLIDTAYSALFLARGRHPVMMNKLRLDTAGRNDRGEWNNRPRDLANLTRFASRELERPVNWQVVSLDREVDDWSDSPILYLASHTGPKLADRDVAKIRAFVDGGGMLFTQADTNSETFNTFASQLAKRLFPEFEFKPLPQDDEIYTLQYILPPGSRPRLMGVRNGSRLLWVHSPTDLAVNWQQRAEKTKREAFELGVNLFVYAGGKTDLRNRVDDRAIPPANVQPSSTIGVARLQYKGNWDPEPAAWPRFARYLLWETSIGIEPTPVNLDQGSALNARVFPLAHLTGTSTYTPTDAELTTLRTYVESGGTLIVEAVGGADSAFSDSLQSTILPRAFPTAKFAPLPKEHPMLHATFKGMEDVYAPKLRQYAVQKLGQTTPPIRFAQVGKGRVIYLPLDTTSGLLGSNTWPILGYDAAEAQALMKNILLWCTENPTTP